MKITLLPDPSEYSENRLFALDALRGFDMMLLKLIGPLILGANASWHCFSKGFLGQFKHNWTGFTLWDIIMPLFIFMCGAAIPFALERRLKDGKLVFWKHVIWRVVLLWTFGGLVQGRWAAFDLHQFSPFSNTLQAIAVGYLAVAVALSVGSRALMIALPIVLAVGYALLLAFCGGYPEWSNLAYRIDQAFLKALLPLDNIWIAKPNYYTWVLTSMMFAAMTFAGYHATQILRLSVSKVRRAVFLAAYGAVLLGVGLVSEIWIPCIKPIYTLSFTAQAMGWCALALAALYVVNDIWMIRKGFSLVLLFGQHALAVYFIGSFLGGVLSACAHRLGDGLIAHLPKMVEPFCFQCLFALVLIATVACWRRFRIMGAICAKR